MFHLGRSPVHACVRVNRSTTMLNQEKMMKKLFVAASKSSKWTRIAETLDEVGRHIQKKYGDESIPRSIIEGELEIKGNYAPGSVHISDYCYNLINKASYSFVFPLFVRIERGKYRYIGPNYKYTGPIYWTPSGGIEKQVGMWESGTCKLENDPRNKV